MAQSLNKAGAKEVIIKSGAEGSAGYSHEQGFIKMPPLSVNAIDTTAAGEAFNAGIVFGMLQGWELPQRLKFANTLAALFISDPERKYPCLEEIEQRMEELKNA